MEQEKFFRTLALILGVIVPLVVVAGSAYFLLDLSTTTDGGTMVADGGEEVSPAVVLANKMSYNDKYLELRGIVTEEATVCERKECPQEDRCCGCPDNKDLFLSNADSGWQSSTAGRMTLLDKGGSHLCSRLVNSCQYGCNSWEPGAIYRVSGKFYATPPPPGWMMSLEYYFMVDGKTMLSQVSWTDTLSNTINYWWGSLRDSLSSGSYIAR